MPSRGLWVLAVVGAMVAVAPTVPLEAQSVLVVEARGGGAVPKGSFRMPVAGADLSAGTAAGVHFALRRGSRTYISLGFSQLRFDCAGPSCGAAWVSTQWEAGVRVDLRSSGVVPWLRLGVVTPSVENVPGEPDAVRGWGGDAGAGVRVPLTTRLFLSPGVRFTAAELGRSAGPDATMRFLVADLGLVVGF